MQEQRRGHREVLGPGPTGLGDPFDPAQAGTQSVTVCHGPYSERLPVADMTVQAIRTRFGARLDIDPLSQAVVDGHEVGDDTVVRDGQLLTFVRKAGEKGFIATRRGKA